MSKFGKVIALILVAIMILSFAACGETSSSGKESSTESSAQQSSTKGGWGSTSRPSRPESSAIELKVADFFNQEVIAYQQKAGVAKTGALDFSWMNDAPAGKHGFVTAKDGDFVFEDGTPVKFWGVNLGFGVAAPEKEVAETIAEELYRLGVNMVRLHATTFGGGLLDYSKGTSQEYNDKYFDRMDYLIYLLKERGIYIHFDVLCGREFFEGDGFTAEEVGYFKRSNGSASATGTGIVKEVRLFDERCKALDLKLAEDLVTHFNPYTEMRYCDDPAFAVFQYVNETCICWQQMSIENPFRTEVGELFNEWLLKEYGTREALDKAWTNDKGEHGLTDAEDPEDGTVVQLELKSWDEQKIMWSNRYVGYNSPARHTDFMRFLYDTEAESFTAFYNKLRELGVKSTINCSNYVIGPVDRKINSLGDVMERNAYWGEKESMTAGADPTTSYPRNTLVEVQCAAVTDKPLVVTEWNCTHNVQFKADGMFQMAAYGALQGWDGFIVFTWTFDAGTTYFYADHIGDQYTINIDPSSVGQLSLCSAIFRLGLVREAENSVEVAYTDADTFAQNEDIMEYHPISFVSKFSYKYIGDKYDGDADFVISAGNTASGDYSSAKKLLVHSINPYSDGYQKSNTRDKWLGSYVEKGAENKTYSGAQFAVGKNVAVGMYGDAQRYFNGAGIGVVDSIMKDLGVIGRDVGYVDGKVISDTKEIVYDYTKNNFVVDTDVVDVFAGNTEAGISAGSFSMNTANDKAAISVMALDQKKIENADKLIIYAMGRCANNNESSSSGGYGYGPIVYEDIRGTMSIVSDKATAKAYGLNYNGERKDELEVTKTDSGFDIKLGGYCHYEVELG